MRIAVAGGTGVVGRYVVAAAEAAGHQVRVISRRRGIDVRDERALREGLAGVAVVIDVLNLVSVRRGPAEAFLTDAAHRLQQAAAGAGADHLVTLSIVGIDRASGFGYYRAKLAQERVALDGPVRTTILRATQFHEFPAQLLTAARKGPIAPVPRMRSQPVAARTVANHLVRLARVQPGGIQELAGPEVHDMPDLARRLLAARSVRAWVVPLPLPGSAGRAMHGDALLATEGTRIDGPTFDTWLSSDDARNIPV
jgi:uncharacterized protein YbjT (DUF2867 family)